MDDLDVRSALTEYVTETEPPLGLTGDDVLAAGRKSRRRRLSAGVAGAAFAVVAILGATFAVTAPQPPPPPPQPAGPVPVDPCGTSRPGETAQQLLTRLSCTAYAAVRSRVTAGARVERLVLHGEPQPADPFLLTTKRAEEKEGSPLVYYMSLRVSDDRGAGSIRLSVLPPAYDGMVTCESPTIPKTASCSRRQVTGGDLLEMVSRNEEGLIVRTAVLKMPTVTIYIAVDNTGVVATGDGVHLPVERAEPPLTSAQLREIAAAPGLVP